jgi:gluconokinase
MIIILFGVAGAGKSLIGQCLAAQLGWKFYDADQFHTSANIEKMRQGIALTDEDRGPWLERLCELLQALRGRGEDAVLACSALKESYRRSLDLGEEIKLVFLKGEYELIEKRLRKRQGHFMNPELLRSQFETLEEPRGGALVVDVKLSPSEIVKEIRSELKI